jgi:hypothetical protein
MGYYGHENTLEDNLSTGLRLDKSKYLLEGGTFFLVLQQASQGLT